LNPIKLEKVMKKFLGLSLILILLTAGCSTNPLVRPFDTAMNKTIGPYCEKKLDEDLKDGKASEAFVKAKKLEIRALRELIKEAKGGSDE